MSTNIYILKLAGGNYYIGKTNDVDKRFNEHLSGKGSTWTKKYKPIGIEKVISNASPYDEDRYVKEYMAKYGINKVRGGSYVTEELEENQEYNLKKEIWGANDCCTQCGRKGHFIKDCYAKTDVYGDEIFNLWECEYCEKEFEDEKECEKHEKQCKKQKNIKQQYNQKYNYPYKNDESSSDDDIQSIRCFKCKKYGHYANNCYSNYNNQNNNYKSNYYQRRKKYDYDSD
jgi:predicted GIY-YIG superfamily endonuclease